MPRFSKHYPGSLKSRFIRLGNAAKIGQIASIFESQPGNCFSGFPVAHPVEEADAAFRNLIFEEEIQRMKYSLGFLNLSLNEMIPFHGEPVAFGTLRLRVKKGKMLENSPILLNQFSLEADHWEHARNPR